LQSVCVNISKIGTGAANQGHRFGVQDGIKQEGTAMKKILLATAAALGMVAATTTSVKADDYWRHDGPNYFTPQKRNYDWDRHHDHDADHDNLSALQRARLHEALRREALRKQRLREAKLRREAELRRQAWLRDKYRHDHDHFDLRFLLPGFSFQYID
jgi:Spy/CpxP family protein refolding chaperone